MVAKFEDQVRIFNSGGLWIDQIRTSADRAWTLVTESTARFSLSVYDPKCNPFVLNYGNLVLIENSDGLPNWAGVIDQIQFVGGECVVNAFTPERYFFYRRGPRKLTLKGNAGEIFAQMVRYVNSLQSTVLVIGDINSATNTMEETLNPVSLTNNLSRIIARSGEGYRWRPVFTNGRLVIYADWARSLILGTGLILQDGYNISGEHPLTLSPPINDVLAYGNGANWDKRIIATALDAQSIQQYGLRQASSSINTKSPDTLSISAQTLLSQFKQPNYSFPIEALNIDDTYKKLKPGALATFTKLVGQGFGSKGIGYLSYDKVIKSMAYNPAVGTVSLAI